jgi:uncharacterized OB-fold protein
MALIKFTRNYNDHSTDSGFQFEFFCDRCGSGYQSTFQGSASNTMTNVLDVASGLFGGLLGNVADAGHRVHSTAWEKQHDQEFQKAVEEVKLLFKHCKRCAKWVDEGCWNPARGLCLECAPDLEAEYSAAQTDAAVQQARQAAQEATYVTKEKFEKTVVGGCPSCGASVAPGAKFCAECGTKVEGSPKFCPECGAKM